MGSLFDSSTNSTNSTTNSSQNLTGTVKGRGERLRNIRGNDDKLFGEEKYPGIVQISQDTRDLIQLEETDSTINQNIKEKIEKLKKEKPNFMDDIKELYGLSEKELMIALGNKELFIQTFLEPYYSSLKLYKYMEEKYINLKKDAKNLENSENERLLKAKINSFINSVNSKQKEVGRNRLRNLLISSIASENTFLRFGADITGQKFGGLHSGLILNETIIEWGCGYCGNSLILPYPKFEEILLAIKLDDKIMEQQQSFLSRLWEFIKNFEFINALKFIFSTDFQLKTLAKDELGLIAEICVDYNKNKNYNGIYQNCQKFIDEILK